jgi:LuxR family maltose regulon positive regulatory protein
MLPFLRTKISVPPARPRRVERTRLLDRMREGAQRGLTLVIAPAGFGKTTLAAAWAQSAGMPVAWLSLETAERAPERFLSYLIQSLQQLQPHLGQTATAILHSGQAVAPDAVLVSLVNDLSDVPGGLAVVLDDYHAADCPEIGAILQFLLENRPAQVHFILATRSAPSLALARLRALDQVIEIGADDLRFRPDEMRAFLEQVMSVQLTPDELARLDRSTEGWAVGLQLAALAHARQSLDWSTPAGQGHIFDYLAEEVLRREPPHVQDFLLRVALFDRFCIPFCDRLLEEEPRIDQPAAGLLAYVERSNLFLIPLDAAGTWFRFHALFSDFLRQQMQQRHPEQLPGLYRAASHWFEQNGLLDDAIHYAVHAGDTGSAGRAAGLIGRHYRDMLLRGEQSALLEWLAELPPDLMTRQPQLWLAKGWANIIAMDALEAAECADRAEAAIPADETGASLRGEAESLRILAGIFQGRVIPEDQISRAFILLAEEDRFLHSILHFNLGMMHVLAGETGPALEDLRETLSLSEGLSNPLITIVAWTQTGEQHQLRGELTLAERAFQQGIEYARRTLGERSFLLGMPYVSYAELLREQNRFEEALRYAELGTSYCLLWQPTASLDGSLALARLRAGQGRWAEAFACYDRALEVAAGTDMILDDAFVTVQRVRAHLLHGDLAQAAQWMKTYSPEVDFGQGYHHMHETARLAALRAQVMETSDPGRALHLAGELAALAPDMERRERTGPFVESLLLGVYALHAAGRHAEAAAGLKRALKLGAQCGYVRLFADEGTRLLHLLDQYRSKLDSSPWLDSLLEVMRRETGRPVPTPDRPAPVSTGTLPADDLIPLTRRELDILALLAAGRSNQEIATECVLAVNTVKKHVANILGKLGVANRTQAVAVARERRWIKID